MTTLATASSEIGAEGQTDVYEIKRIDFLANTQVPILLQSKNGPCPLLAIANVLLLSKQISLPDYQQDISLQNLVHIVADRLIEANPVDDSQPDAANKRKAIEDAIEMLPNLAQGLDINVKFADVDLFEFDRAVGVFDIIGVNLYHGWVIDPLDEMYEPLRQLAYNTLVERVVNYDLKSGSNSSHDNSNNNEDDSSKIMAEGQIAQNFLHEHASQLTYAGLARLYDKVKDRELCVFFRNNHFSTMFRYEGHLYLLCTDSGFKNKGAIVWERLTDINGDTELCSPTFGDPNAFLSADDILQDDFSMDEALAKQLEIEESIKNGQQPSNQPVVWDKSSSSQVKQPAQAVNASANEPMSPDEALARQLQLEENKAALNERQMQQREKKQESSTCTLC